MRYGVLELASNDDRPKDSSKITGTATQIADGLVHGNRNQDYGPPHKDFSRTASMWSVILQGKLLPGATISPHEVGLCQIAVKLSRECHKHKQDNLVDICGYAECVDWMYREPEGGQ